MLRIKLIPIATYVLPHHVLLENFKNLHFDIKCMTIHVLSKYCILLHNVKRDDEVF